MTSQSSCNPRPTEEELAPAQVCVDAGFGAGALEQFEGLPALRQVVLRRRRAPEPGIAGVHVGERKLAAGGEEFRRQRDRVWTAAVTVDTDEDVLEHDVPS